MSARWISSLAVACATLGVVALAPGWSWGQQTPEREPERIGATIRRAADSPAPAANTPAASNNGAGSNAPTGANPDNRSTTGSSTRGAPNLEPLQRSNRANESGASGDDRTPSGRPASSTRPVERPLPPEAVNVNAGDGTIPNRHGQVWREYDIYPYTQTVTSTKRPEQAIIDWILHDTGYEVWHGETVAMLSGDLKTLRVYHTPDVQTTVSDIVSRFVTRPIDSHAIGLRIITIGGPDWRVRAERLMTPISAETPGVSAWVMRPEDAALVLGDLAKRSDFREHTAPQLTGQNGQSLDVVATRPRRYVQGVTFGNGADPTAQTIGTVNEGLSLSLLPLLSKDGKDVDAIIRCTVDQVEKLQPVVLEAAALSGRQRTQIEVPQVASYRLHERFRWPSSQVLLISAGMVVSPTPAVARPIPLPLSTAPRVEMLIAVDARAQVAPVAGTGGALSPAAGQNRGRY